MNKEIKMPAYHVKCVEQVNFTVKIEAENEEQAKELAVEDINSHEIVSESTTDWDIEEVILESEEWYNQPDPVGLESVTDADYNSEGELKDQA